MASPWGEAVERSETDEGNNLANHKHFPIFQCGPLIRPFGAPSPQGEGMDCTKNYNLSFSSHTQKFNDFRGRQFQDPVL